MGIETVNGLPGDSLHLTGIPATFSEACRGKKDCRTRVLVDNFYLCLDDQPDCNHSSPFGVSTLCTFPKRLEYSI